MIKKLTIKLSKQDLKILLIHVSMADFSLHDFPVADNLAYFQNRRFQARLAKKLIDGKREYSLKLDPEEALCIFINPNHFDSENLYGQAVINSIHIMIYEYFVNTKFDMINPVE